MGEVADVLEDVVAAVEQSAVDLQELHSAGEPAVPEEVSASVSVAPEVAAPGAFVEEVAEAETVEEVAVEEVAVEESVAEEVALQEVADEDPTVEGEAVKEMTLQEVSAAEAGDEEVAVEEPSVGEEVAVEEVVVEGIAVEEVADEEVKAGEIPVVELCEEVSVAETAEDLPTTEFIDDITEKEDIPIDSEAPCQRVEEVTEEPPVVREGDSEAENETHAKEIFSATEISEKEKLIKETSAEQIMAMKQATEESTTPALA